MDRALAVVGSSKATKELVREAGELAGGVDAELVALHVTSESEYNDSLEELEAIPDADVSYGVDQARQTAKQFADDIASEVLADVDVKWEAVGAMGNRAEAIVEEARINDCDHVFIAGKSRSPTGKALFGDDTQEVILTFDGAVTVVTE